MSDEHTETPSEPEVVDAVPVNTVPHEDSGETEGGIDDADGELADEVKKEMHGKTGEQAEQAMDILSGPVQARLRNRALKHLDSVREKGSDWAVLLELVTNLTPTQQLDLVDGSLLTKLGGIVGDKLPPIVWQLNLATWATRKLTPDSCLRISQFSRRTVLEMLALGVIPCDEAVADAAAKKLTLKGGLTRAAFKLAAAADPELKPVVMAVNLQEKIQNFELAQYAPVRAQMRTEWTRLSEEDAAVAEAANDEHGKMADDLDPPVQLDSTANTGHGGHKEDDEPLKHAA